MTVNLAQADPEARLQWLMDRVALEDLVTRYARCVDQRLWDEWAMLFTDDGEFHTPFFRVRKHELAGWLAENLEHYPVTQHMMTNLEFEIDGDSARGKYYVHATHLPRAEALTRHSDVGGWYEADMRRVDGEWKFRHLRVSFAWTAGEEFLPAEKRRFGEWLGGASG